MLAPTNGFPEHREELKPKRKPDLLSYLFGLLTLAFAAAALWIRIDWVSEIFRLFSFLVSLGSLALIFVQALKLLLRWSWGIFFEVLWLGISVGTAIVLLGLFAP